MRQRKVFLGLPLQEWAQVFQLRWGRILLLFLGWWIFASFWSTR
jgi:hypothetical protein